DHHTPKVPVKVLYATHPPIVHYPLKVSLMILAHQILLWSLLPVDHYTLKVLVYHHIASNHLPVCPP
ncbi:hypothetical protein BDQ17DRAFT_1377147, partial [Cyathus striatus]